MSKQSVTQMATALLQVRQGQSPPFEAIEAQGPASLAEAYAVQAEVARILEKPIGGWKVGGPLDGQPMFAPIFAEDIQTQPASLNASSPIGIECEIAFRLKSDVPASGLSYSEMLDYVDAVLAVIETVDGRIQNPVDAPALWKLADNQVNHGLILGSMTTGITPSLWQNADIRLAANGQEIKHATGANPGGDSLGLLCWLARHIDGHCGGLRAGQIVTTGSYTGIDLFAPGTGIRADFGPSGAIALTI